MDTCWRSLWGERRRLQLTRLLMDAPNVLMLDEPTNDFDIETLTELEDLLDSFGGTLLVISHDRYFLERVCDSFVGLLGDKELRDLPRGIDQYLELRYESTLKSQVSSTTTKNSNAAQERQLKKDLTRIERQSEKVRTELAELEKQLEDVAFNPDELILLGEKISITQKTLNDLEEEWLSLTMQLEGDE